MELDNQTITYVVLIIIIILLIFYLTYNVGTQVSKLSSLSMKNQYALGQLARLTNNSANNDTLYVPQ